MDALPQIVAAIVVAAVAIVSVRLALRARRAHASPEKRLAGRQLASDITFVAIGALLMAISLIAGWHLFDVEGPPRDEYFQAGVGIAPDVRAKAGRGFVVGLAAKFDDCDDPVEITIAIAGTAEYFEDNEAWLRKRTAFTIAVPSKSVGELTLGYGDERAGGYEDVLKPHRASMGAWLPEDTVRVGDEVARQEVTSISGSIENWPSHVASLVLTFDADWLAPRGVGTCYLRLPPLVGFYSVIGAQDGVGRAARNPAELPIDSPDPITNDGGTLYAPYEKSLFVRNAVTVVQPGDNEVLRSEPSANTVSAGLPSIVCSQSPLVLGERGAPGASAADLVLGSGNRSAFAIRERVFFEQLGQLDCGAVLTMAEASAGLQRDLILLLVGAFFSLGAAVLLEIGLDLNRRRLGGETRVAAAAVSSPPPQQDTPSPRSGGTEDEDGPSAA